METLKHWLAAALFVLGFGFLMAAFSGAFAADKGADLGGNCCADLEERVAELEATTARKGNRKVKIFIYGQVSEALVWWNAPGIGSHSQVQSNSNRDAVSLVGVGGEALISPGLKAGFIAEFGVGGFTNAVAFPTNNGMDTNGVYVRQELVYIKSDAFGKLSIGKQELASFNATGAQEGNTGVAHTMLSIAPIVGPPLGSVLDLWDGGIGSTVKYSSPHLFALHGKDGGRDGLWLEADWGNADDLKASGFAKTNGNLWDVAVHALKQYEQFELSGVASYRNGVVIDASGTNLSFPLFSGMAVQDVKVWTVAGGLKHMPTGAFVNATYGDLDFSTLATGAPHLKAWEAQVGIEEKWMPFGKTSVFFQYGEFDLGGSAGLGKIPNYGLGLVQNIEPAAMDLYVTWERYQPDATAKSFLGLTGDPSVVMAGGRIKF